MSKSSLIFIAGLIIGNIFTLFYSLIHKIENENVVEVISVYDGDTFKVNLTGEREIFGENLSIRLRGIDTPEIRGSSDE